jgi:hypothetical protein
VPATVLNLGSEWITPQRALTATVQAGGVQTVVPARITALAPGEEAPRGGRRSQRREEGPTAEPRRQAPRRGPRQSP